MVHYQPAYGSAVISLSSLALVVISVAGSLDLREELSGVPERCLPVAVLHILPANTSTKGFRGGEAKEE